MTPRTRETAVFYGGPLAFLAILTALEPTGVGACVAGLWHVVELTWWMVLLLACGVGCLAAVVGGRR